ncbi:MAG: ribonuclease R [Bacteriovoracia bacterium]
MAKLKLRFRNEILQALSQAQGPITLRVLLRSIFSKEELSNPKIERAVDTELRYLVKIKEVERGSGGLFRIRPPKTNRAKQIRGHDQQRPGGRQDNRELREELAQPRLASGTPGRLTARRGSDKGNQRARDARGEHNRNSQRSGGEERNEERGREGRPSNFRERQNSEGNQRGDSRQTGKRPPPKNLVTGKVMKNSRGFAFVAPIDPPPFLKEDVFLNPEEAEDLLTGDIVEIVLDNTRAEKGYSGRLYRVVERGLQKAVARYIKGTAYAPPMAEIDTKEMQLQIVLERDPTYKDVVDGSAIVVEVTKMPQGGGQIEGRILNVLADSLNSTTDDPYIIVKHKLRETFPDEVIAEAKAIPSEILKSDIKDREDLRDLPFVTIDGADARDFDDAVCARKLPNGQVRLWVAIADVAHYVRPGTALDKEAYERATSIYFPHRVLPMLPERLSNGICSLNPNEDRLAMVAEIDFDLTGRKVKHRVLEAVFRSQHRCVYETLQQFFDRPENGHEYNPRVRESLALLFDLYKKLHHLRIQRGSIDLNLPEAKVKVNKETGEVDTIIRTERLDSHRLIEEFMIVANETVSEIMEEHKMQFIFRVHEMPEEDAVKRFMDVARTLQVRINEKWIDDINPITYQKILRAIEENPASRVLNFLMLRSMKQAYYTTTNLKHFGLASQAYSHFTSPIRRYPDLMVHRLLKAFIHKSKKEASMAKGSVAKDLEEAAAHCSKQERVATDAERELIRIKQVRYAERHLGEEHTGTVVGINAKGAFVELTDVFVEGFVPIERLGADFTFNEKLFHLRGKRSGLVIQVGNKIDVQIVRTNPHLLQIELEPLQGKAKKNKPAITASSTPVAESPKKNIPPAANRDFWTPEDFE